MIDTKNLKQAWALLDRHERRNAWVVLAVVAISSLGAALMVGSIYPFLAVLSDSSRIHEVSQLQWAYDTFNFTSDYAFLVALGIGTLSVIVLANLLQLARLYVITRYSHMRMYSLSRKLLSLYLHQPYEFFLDRHSGDMSTKVLSEVDQTVNSFFRPVAELTSAVLTISALVVLLLWVDPAVALGVFLIVGGMYGVIFLVLRERLSALGEQRLHANRARFVTAKEVFSGIKEVKLHGHEDVYLRRYGSAAFTTVHRHITASIIGMFPRHMIQMLALGGLVLLCIFLVDPATFNSGRSALGDLLPTLGVIAFAGQRMMPELSRLYESVTRMKFGMASVKSLFQDIQMAGQAAAPMQNARWAEGKPLGLRAELRLENVSYKYPEASRNSLSETSISINAGERVGIVGGTGAGKTTLADLALGLIHPSSGQILIDGVPLDRTNLSRWQRSVGYVPQDIFLLDASISENIAFGLQPRQINQARVEEVARIAQLETFVKKELPAGFDTRVGERGVRLSGGQRQRIGVARALYQKADLIVFDEATSALDNLTEREVIAAIEGIPGNTTVLMIAHRLSTLKSCDRIIVLHEGRVSGIGTWEELLEQNPSFQALAKAA